MEGIHLSAIECQCFLLALSKNCGYHHSVSRSTLIVVANYIYMPLHLEN